MIPAVLYLWGGQLLIRTMGGVTGLATAEACCCVDDSDCMCDDVPMPRQLTLTFTNCTERMLCLEGKTLELYWLTDFPNIIWGGEIEITTSATPPVTQRLVFTLICDSDFTLSIATYEGETLVDNFCFTSSFYGVGTAFISRTETEDPQPAYYSSCSPLSLMYGPFEVNARDVVCNWCYAFLEPFMQCVFSIPPNPIPGGPECQGEFWIEITA